MIYKIIKVELEKLAMIKYLKVIKYLKNLYNLLISKGYNLAEKEKTCIIKQNHKIKARILYKKINLELTKLAILLIKNTIKMRIKKNQKKIHQLISYVKHLKRLKFKVILWLQVNQLQENMYNKNQYQKIKKYKQYIVINQIIRKQRVN